MLPCLIWGYRDSIDFRNVAPFSVALRFWKAAQAEPKTARFNIPIDP